jgi:hypothetical protein
MKTYQWLLAGVATAGLAACEGGGVDLNVSTVDNSVDNSVTNPGGNTGNNPCAFYSPPNSTEVRRGSFDGTNCSYGSDFVSASNPLLVDVTIPFISGVHIFQDSLFVGQNVNSGAAPAGGTGPTLTIAAGNRLAFTDSADYVLINRGSQIVANGSPAAPIVFTAFADAVLGTAGANDVSLWGGMVINGNGITNNCTDAERAGNLCHVVAEGQPSNYGGSDNDESSGVLRYVIVKHTGFEVAPGDELNGITFNAVGSGTILENVQVYSTFDDGLEWFGGAMGSDPDNLMRNLVVLYARDDSLDFSDGHIGTIENALIIHWQTDGNRCIELDNIGESRSNAGQTLDRAPITATTVRNMTCIVSNSDQTPDGNTHGDSEGVLVRQGGRLLLEDSIVYSGHGTRRFATEGLTRTSNECYEIDDNAPLDLSRVHAVNGATEPMRVTNTIIACELPAQDSLPNGDTILSWIQGTGNSTGTAYAFNAGNQVISTPVDAGVSVLAPNSFYTATSLTGPGGAALGMTPASGKMGAVLASDDWTAPWAFGLRSGNADTPLWFAP